MKNTVVKNQNILKNQLKKLPTHSLKAWVIQTALDEDSPIDWLRDVTRHGCVSGMATELIYYHDTVKFYDRFSDEIWEMVNEFCDSTGFKLGKFLDGFSVPMNDDTRFKNGLAWFSVEETANQLLSEIEGGDW